MREIEQIKNATVGKETREPIARTLEKIASNFNNGQNTNQEVVEARGTHSTLNARLNVIESNIGDLSKLKTKNKSSIEGALNELAKKLGIVIVPPTPPEPNYPSAWTTKANLLQARELASVCGIDGNAYISNGRISNNTEASTIEMLNISNNSISKIYESSFIGTYWVGNCAIDKYIYMVGGKKISSLSNKCFCFNTETKVLIGLSEISSDRRSAFCIPCNDKIYAFGGVISDWTKIVEVYDKTTNVWEQKADMPVACKVYCGYVSGDFIYLVCADLKIRRYSVIADVFEEVETLDNSNLTNIIAVEKIGNRIYFLRSTNSQSLDTIIYDFVKKEWNVAPGMTVPRTNVATCVIDNKIVVAGGYDGTNRLNTIEIFE